jgi:hypothetical protein
MTDTPLDASRLFSISNHTRDEVLPRPVITDADIGHFLRHGPKLEL